MLAVRPCQMIRTAVIKTGRQRVGCLQLQLGLFWCCHACSYLKRNSMQPLAIEYVQQCNPLPTSCATIWHACT